MIRNLFLALFFFFGPALVMFMVRNVLLLLRIWFRARALRDQPEVIDITPVERTPAPRWFYAAAIVLGLTTAVFGFMRLQGGGAEVRHYIPAHIDAQGELIPGHWQSPSLSVAPVTDKKVVEPSK